LGSRLMSADDILKEVQTDTEQGKSFVRTILEMSEMGVINI